MKFFFRVPWRWEAPTSAIEFVRLLWYMYRLSSCVCVWFFCVYLCTVHIYWWLFESFTSGLGRNNRIILLHDCFWFGIVVQNYLVVLSFLWLFQWATKRITNTRLKKKLSQEHNAKINESSWPQQSITIWEMQTRTHLCFQIPNQ